MLNRHGCQGFQEAQQGAPRHHLWIGHQSQCTVGLDHDIVWVVVSTPLKNISQWEGLSHILWKYYGK